jgi:hypothetical protein
MMSATEEHKHTWKMTMHLDGCHWWASAYACAGRGPGKKCGATVTVTEERDPKRMMSGIWMEEQYEEIRRDERGRYCKPHWEVKVCDRCRELQAGAKVRYDMVMVDAKGNVIEERHEEREQRSDEDEEDE